MTGTKTRFIGILSALLISGFLITSLVSYFVAQDSISEEIADNSLPLTSDNIYSEIQRDLLRPIFISSLMANDTFVRDWAISGEEDHDKIVRYLGTIQKRYDTITAFFISDKTRNYYHSTGLLKQVHEEVPADDWYFRVRDLKEPYEVNVDNDGANKNQLTIFINYRMYDYTGKFIGVTGVGLSTNDVTHLIDSYQKRYGREIYFINREGDVSLSGPAFHGFENIHKDSNLAPHATKILTSPSVSLRYEKEDDTLYLNSRLVPEFDWYLIVEQSASLAESRIQNTLFINFLIAAVITIIMLIIANFTIGDYQERLETMASTDKLTGATSRQVFKPMFEQTIKEAKRAKGPTSAILLDIDKFKSINDHYGHLGGDFVLQKVVGNIRQQIRESDILCRWGGDEFFVLLPNCNIEQATIVAEEVRKRIQSLNIDYHRQTIKVTASIGVAELSPAEELNAFFNRADHALYLAKTSGRNRVSTSTQSEAA